MSRKARRTRRSPSAGSPARGAARAAGFSLCMIVRNEERFLAAALASVQGVVDEICIVDTGSTDGTVAVAESFGAVVAHVPWRDDFSFARNAALAMATRAWILVLDADERLAPRSRDDVLALGREAPDGAGRWIWCRNLGDAETETVTSTNAIVRIFPNDPKIRYRGRLHEFVARAGEPGSLHASRSTIEILHYGYQSAIMAERGKGERNLRMSEAALAADPDNPVLVYNYATSASLARRDDIARVQLERVVALTEGTPRGFRPQALNLLAGIYLNEGRPVDALLAADRCIAIVATFPDGHFVRGRALAALGRFREARDAYGAAIANGQRRGEHFVVEDAIASWKAHNEIAGTLMVEKRFADARQWLELALRNRPAERALIVNRAICCEETGDLPAALAAFRTAFEAFRDEDAAIKYVNFVFRHGTPDECVAAVDAVLPVASAEYRCAFLASAAAVMLRAGRRDDARLLLGRVLGARDDRAAAEGIVRTLAAHYQTPELQDLLADAEPALNGSGGPA
jgi:tetratricopeptide (TPR) repeat protein